MRYVSWRSSIIDHTQGPLGTPLRRAFVASKQKSIKTLKHFWIGMACINTYHFCLNNQPWVFKQLRNSLQKRQTTTLINRVVWAVLDYFFCLWFIEGPPAKRGEYSDTMKLIVAALIVVLCVAYSEAVGKSINRAHALISYAKVLTMAKSLFFDIVFRNKTKLTMELVIYFWWKLINKRLW